MFAWAVAERAPQVLAAMQAQFASRQIGADGWVIDIESTGARLVGG